MKKHKSVLYSIGISAVILTAVATGSLSSSASEIDTKAVSPALCVIAEDSEMAMAGIIGNSIAFEKQDFSRALNVSKMGDIEITQAPPISEGELRV